MQKINGSIAYIWNLKMNSSAISKELYEMMINGKLIWNLKWPQKLRQHDNRCNFVVSTTLAGDLESISIEKHLSWLQINFLEKLPKLADLQIFQSSYLSYGESLNHNTL